MTEFTHNTRYEIQQKKNNATKIENLYKYLQSSTDPRPKGIAPCEPEEGLLATVLNFPGPSPIPIGDGFLFPPAKQE